MIRRVLAAAALALAGLSVPVAAAPQVTPLLGRPVHLVTGHVRPLMAYQAAGLTLGQAATVRMLDSLVAGGVPAQWVQPRVTAERQAGGPLGAPCGFHFIFRFDGTLADVPAGDLDGDHRPDVVVTYEAPPAKKATTHLLGLSFRDAKTGRVHWSRTQRVRNNGYHFTVPTPLGRTRAPGVLLFDVSYASEGTGLTGTDTVTLAVTAIDGHGRTLWHVIKSGTHHYTGTSGTYSHVPDQLALAALSSSAPDLVVSTFSGSGSSSYVLQGVVVSSKDGRQRKAFPDVDGTTSLSPLDPTGLLLSSSPALLFGVIPDQDDDHREDLWTASVGTPSELRAISGRTGLPLWTNDTLVLESTLDVLDAGVLVDLESKRHDLAVTTGGDALGFGLAVAGVEVPSVDTARVMLLTGGTGQLRWLRFGDLAWPTRGVHTGGVPAVAVASVSQNKPSVPDGVPSPSSLGGVTLTADVSSYDVNGLPLAQRTYSWTRDLTACDLAIFRTNLAVGDVDVDGYADLDLTFEFVTFFDVTYADSWQTQTVSGRTAAVLRRTSADFPLGVSVDGRGEDRLALTASSGHVGLRAVSGDRGALLWSVSRKVPSGNVGWDGYALPTTSARCTDTVFDVGEYSSDPEALRVTTQLLSSAGEPWWTLRYRGTRDVIGELTTERVPRRRC